MSVVTQINEVGPNYLWILGSLPLGLGLDLALGDLPGRGRVERGMGWLIAITEDGVRRAVERLGGGRGGDLVAGVLLAVMVVGTTSSVAWLVANLGDSIGGPAALAVRAGLIAAALAARAPGDRILRAVEATDRAAAARWLAAAGGQPPPRLDQLGVDRVGVAAVGELTSSRIVGPLFWLALGGPTGLWGFLAARSLREAMQGRGGPGSLAAGVVATLVDLAEQVPAILTWLLMGVAAGLTRNDPFRAWRVGGREGARRPRSIPTWGQATLAGALGVQVAAGRVFAADARDQPTWVGAATRGVDALTVVRAVRIMQVTTLLAAGLVVLVTTFW